MNFFSSKSDKFRKKIDELESELKIYKSTFKKDLLLSANQSFLPTVIIEAEAFIKKSREEIINRQLREKDFYEKCNSLTNELKKRRELYEKSKEIFPLFYEIILLKLKQDNEISTSTLTEINSDLLREEAIIRFMNSDYVEELPWKIEAKTSGKEVILKIKSL